MVESIGDPPEIADGSDAGASTIRMTIALGIASGGLFALGLLISESFGELALDIDLKPFFVPFLLISVTRYGLPTMSIGLGAALGEGVLDLLETFELDDPIGFLGYVFGFIAFGWYLEQVADDPSSPRALTTGAILGALIQAFFEGIAFFVFEATASWTDSLLSIGGNTVTHGVLLGAVPLVLVHDFYGSRLPSFA